MSKLHSTCPEEHFEEKDFFVEFVIFLIFLDFEQNFFRFLPKN